MLCRSRVQPSLLGEERRPDSRKRRKSSLSCYSLPIFSASRALHHPYPRAFCTPSSFARIKSSRWRPVELNDRHLRSHGKIGDCEQSSHENKRRKRDQMRLTQSGHHGVRDTMRPQVNLIHLSSQPWLPT